MLEIFKNTSQYAIHYAMNPFCTVIYHQKMLYSALASMPMTIIPASIIAIILTHVFCLLYISNHLLLKKLKSLCGISLCTSWYCTGSKML